MKIFVAAPVAKIEDSRRVGRLDGRPFRPQLGLRFELNLTSRFELDLTSVSNSIWRPFRAQFDILDIYYFRYLFGDAVNVAAYNISTQNFAAKIDIE